MLYHTAALFATFATIWTFSIARCCTRIPHTGALSASNSVFVAPDGPTLSYRLSFPTSASECEICIECRSCREYDAAVVRSTFHSIHANSVWFWIEDSEENTVVIRRLVPLFKNIVCRMCRYIANVATTMLIYSNKLYFLVINPLLYNY